MSSPLYSQTVAYTVRAFVNLAREPVGTYKMNKRIASEEGIPAPYLSKLLQHFARLELLKSTKGPAGGFALRFAPRQIRLIDIVAPLDGLAQYKRCAAGLSECSDEMPCSMHEIGRSCVAEYWHIWSRPHFRTWPLHFQRRKRTLPKRSAPRNEFGRLENRAV